MGYTRTDKLIDWLKTVEEPRVNKKDMNSAIYILNQGGGGWPDFIELYSIDTVILCWKLVEKLNRELYLPEEFMA